MLEIRGHARGGQGMVTAFEILAKIFSKLDTFQVQSFPAFGVERTGAPIQAFLRAAKTDILNRSNVYHPDLIVIFDESLLDQVPVFDGLNENGSILINTERDITHLKDKYKSIYTVPATNISLEKGLGSKSLPIVNAAMMGAMMRLFNADIEIARKIISGNVPSKPGANGDAAFIAFNSVAGIDKMNSHLIDSLHSTEKPVQIPVELIKKSKKALNLKELPEIPYWNLPMSNNKTGNWRVLTPEYTTRNAPCSANCPAGTDVRGFVKLAGENKFDDALELIYEHNPFPSTCGRVCPHFCEQNCNRNELDAGLNIGAVERFLGDRIDKHMDITPAEIKHNEKIAVIGSGPAGLTAALALREKGYETTVFEALPYSGGMMRTGIPEFRLPNNALDKEIDRVEKKGVKIILNKKVKIKDLENEYSAAVVAVGSHIGTKMNIPNEDLVLEGIKFLYNFKLGKDTQGVAKDDEVAVIGGGNTAIDVARTVLRLGGKPTIYYRRTHKEMPAISHEVEEALAEGVRIEFLTAPAALDKTQTGKLNLTLIQMELGEPDASGRKRPVPVKGSENSISVDKVITATGQKFDSHVFGGSEVKPVQGKIDFGSDIPVFTAGDMAWGGTVTEAIGSGNKVAEEVHAYFRNLPYSHEDTKKDIVIPVDLNFAYFMPTPRYENTILKKNDFYNDFTEVVQGLSEDEILKETHRCMHCGECFSCGNCYNYCPDSAVHIDENGRLRIDYDYCKGCGICAQECPSSAITFNLHEVNHE